MSIGYACLTVGVENTGMKSCIAKNATPEKLSELIKYNLRSLDNIIEYNRKQGIFLFRISSDIIPFGSSPINTLEWDKIFEKEFFEIGEKIKNYGIRVSMHPGQYTIINSPREDVIERSIKDLEYHTRFLHALNTSSQSKLVLHIGGKYNDINKATERFCLNYQRLSDDIKERIVIENDDRMYSIDEILSISKNTDIPVVFDNLHNIVNPSEINMSEEQWIKEAGGTWKAEDGRQKIHYSIQNTKKQSGAHSETIYIKQFKEFYDRIKGEDIDIMLEVKDKNLSAVKCNNLIRNDKKIKYLEEEWSRYKYNVLEHSQNDYKSIRELLKDKKDYPVIEFYTLIEDAMSKKTNIGDTINSILHVWGYLSGSCTEKEKTKFQNMIQLLNENKIKDKRVKKYLFQMVLKYEEEYLHNSLFFSF